MSTNYPTYIELSNQAGSEIWRERGIYDLPPALPEEKPCLACANNRQFDRYCGSCRTIRTADKTPIVRISLKVRRTNHSNNLALALAILGIVLMCVIAQFAK
jgi:hypothetical protein